MQNLIPLILIGFFIYLIFSRKGGMGGLGCCGGHGAQSSHTTEKDKKTNHEPVSQMHDDSVIDLREGKDYIFLPTKDDERRLG